MIVTLKILTGERIRETTPVPVVDNNLEGSLIKVTVPEPTTLRIFLGSRISETALVAIAVNSSKRTLRVSSVATPVPLVVSIL